MKEKDATLYNYLYNYIIKNPYYMNQQTNKQLSKECNISVYSISTSLNRLAKDKKINYNVYNYNTRSLTLPYTISELDNQKRKMYPNIKIDSNDVVRKSLILINQYCIDTIDYGNATNMMLGADTLEISKHVSKVSKYIHDILKDKFFVPFYSSIKAHYAFDNYNIGITHKNVNPDYKQRDQLVLYYHFSVSNYTTHSPSGIIPYKSNLDFWLKGRSDKDIHDRFDKFYHHLCNQLSH